MHQTPVLVGCHCTSQQQRWQLILPVLRTYELWQLSLVASMVASRRSCLHMLFRRWSSSTCCVMQTLMVNTPNDAL